MRLLKILRRIPTPKKYHMDPISGYALNFVLLHFCIQLLFITTKPLLRSLYGSFHKLIDKFCVCIIPLLNLRYICTKHNEL